MVAEQIPLIVEAFWRVADNVARVLLTAPVVPGYLESTSGQRIANT